METPDEKKRPKLDKLKSQLRFLLKRLDKRPESADELPQNLSTILSELRKLKPLSEIENGIDRHNASTARTSLYVDIMALAKEKGISIPLTPDQKENLAAVGVQIPPKDVNELKDDFDRLLRDLLDTNSQYNDSRIQLLYNDIKSYGTLLFDAKTPVEIDIQVRNIETVLGVAEELFQYETGVLAVFQPILNALSASVAFIANLLPKLLFPEFWLGNQDAFVEKYYQTPKTTASQVLESSQTKVNFFGRPADADAALKQGLKEAIKGGKDKIAESNSNKSRPHGV